MGAFTEISWATHTFNCWRGCSKVHEGCAHCYAERDSKRFPLNRGIWGPNGTRVMAAADMWRQPIKWNKAAEKAGERHRVFCASLADVFEDWQGAIVDHNGHRLRYHSILDTHMAFTGNDMHRDECDNWTTMNHLRCDLFELIDQTPHLDWLLVTKRPENIRRMWPEYHPCGKPGCEVLHIRQNVWLLTSVSNQATADKQIPPLLECRDLCPVLGLSVEPLLGPIDFSAYFGGEYATIEGSEPNYNFGLDWLICGGESGTGARPMHPSWVRSIRDQCIKASVPFFFKQFGEWAPAPWTVARIEGESDEAFKIRAEGIDATHAISPDGHLHQPSHRGWSSYRVEPLRPHAAIRRVGKKNAGRTLDGQTWDQMPEPKASVPT